MSEIELFPDDNSFDTTGPPASPVAVQRTTAPQDTTIEPLAATWGHRPSHAITFAFQVSATFSSIVLCFSPLLRPSCGETDYVRHSSASASTSNVGSPWRISTHFILFSNQGHLLTPLLHPRPRIKQAKYPSKPPLPRGQAFGHQATAEGCAQMLQQPARQIRINFTQFIICKCEL